MQVAFCAGFQSSKLHNTWLYSAARTFLSFQSPHVLAVMKSCELQTNGFIIAPPEHSSFQSPHVLLAMSSATDDVPWLYLQSLVRQGDKQRPEMEQLLGSSFACSCQQSMSMWPVTAGNLTDSPRSQAASDQAISGRATGHCRRVHDAHARANRKLSAPLGQQGCVHRQFTLLHPASSIRYCKSEVRDAVLREAPDMAWVLHALRVDEESWVVACWHFHPGPPGS